MKPDPRGGAIAPSREPLLSDGLAAGAADLTITWGKLLRRARISTVKVHGKTISEAAVKHVAGFLAGCADPDGTNVRPGLACIAIETGLSCRLCARALAYLEQHGWLTRVGRGADKIAEYRLTIPADLATNGIAVRSDAEYDRDHAALSAELAHGKSQPAGQAVEVAPPVDNSLVHQAPVTVDSSASLVPDGPAKAGNPAETPRPVDNSLVPDGPVTADNSSLVPGGPATAASSASLVPYGPATADVSLVPYGPATAKKEAGHYSPFTKYPPLPPHGDRQGPTGAGSATRGGEFEMDQEQRIRRLVGEIVQLRRGVVDARPWSPQSVRDAINECLAAGRSIEAIEIAFRKLASDSTTRYPGRAAVMDEAWWAEAGPAKPKPKRPDCAECCNSRSIPDPDDPTRGIRCPHCRPGAPAPKRAAPEPRPAMAPGQVLGQLAEMARAQQPAE